jgi:hypothetical protein
MLNLEEAYEDKEKQGVDYLNQLFKDGEKCDEKHFAEQRTNILLYQGEHFKKKASQFMERNKDVLTDNAKIKLSENHIQVIVNRWHTSVTNSAPGCLIVPNNENENADIKDAELCNSVKSYAEEQMNYEDKVDRLAKNLIITGEAFQFYYFDPYGGRLIGYQQKVDENGQPLFHAPDGTETTESVGVMGEQFQPVQGKEPVFEGEIKMKVVHPYNVIRHKAAESIDESPFLCMREMIALDEACKFIKDKPADEYKKIKASFKEGSESAFKVFDATSGEYGDTQGQVLIKYWFFRQSQKYPNGHFKIQICDEIVSEGDLPYGIWPIEYVGFRTVAGAARASSIIKDLRPAQTTLNFLVSNSAFHLIALGDDKVFTQLGSKLQMGPTWNGIRSFQVNGPAPTIMPGRDASQFERAIERQVNTIYRLSDDVYQTEESKMQDPTAMLYSRLSQKQKHSPIAKKFERFLCNGWKIYLALAKHYLDDNAVIKRIGKREAINIAEFRRVREDGYTIKAKPVSGTIEEQLGKSMEIREVLQYVGKELPMSTKAKLINQLPFVSKDSVMSDLLLTEKNIENDILALDRGEQIPAAKDDDHEQYLARLKARMKQADFRLLPPQVQQNYEMRRQQHVDFAAQLAQELREAEAGMWPMDGGLVKVDIYDNNGKRMVMPSGALIKLQEVLAKQGAAQEHLQRLDKQTQIEIESKAQQLAAQNQQQGMGQAVGMQQPQPMPPIA